MNIGKINTYYNLVEKIPTKVKVATMALLLGGAAIECNNARNSYINTLKQEVKANVEPEVYNGYEKEANQFGVNEEEVFQNAYDSIRFTDRSYFEGSQSATISNELK